MRIEHNDCFGKSDPLIMKMTSMKYIYHGEMKQSCLKNWQIVSIIQKCHLCVFLHEINQFSSVQVTKNFLELLFTFHKNHCCTPGINFALIVWSRLDFFSNFCKTKPVAMLLCLYSQNYLLHRCFFGRSISLCFAKVSNRPKIAARWNAESTLGCGSWTMSN